MAQQQQKPSIKSLWKGKQWYEIVSPKMFDEKIVGETPSSDPKHLVGRTLSSNLSQISGNPTKYYFKIRFRVNNINGSRLMTEYFGHDCSKDFISRMVRVRSKRIDTRDIITTKDGKKMVVKTISATLNPILTSIKNGVRKEVSKVVAETLSEMTLEAFVKDMISGKIQKTLKSKASKIYPIRELEIRKTEILD